jgi:hypothetical protein
MPERATDCWRASAVPARSLPNRPESRQDPPYSTGPKRHFSQSWPGHGIVVCRLPVAETYTRCATVMGRTCWRGHGDHGCFRTPGTLLGARNGKCLLTCHPRAGRRGGAAVGGVPGTECAGETNRGSINLGLVCSPFSKWIVITLVGFERGI